MKEKSKDIILIIRAIVGGNVAIVAHVPNTLGKKAGFKITFQRHIKERQLKRISVFVFFLAYFFSYLQSIVATYNRGY